MDYEYDPEPTTFSLVARLIVMFCMGYACGFYMGFWGPLVAIPLSFLITILWLRYVDGIT